MIKIETIGSGRTLTMDGKPFIMLAGELHNSSAASHEDIFDKLQALRDLHLNTVLVPLSWELIEPEEGQFDFSLLDETVKDARLWGQKIVFLWFGTMKNAISCYVPAWVKTDTERFWRAEGSPGHKSWTVSPFCHEVLECDARAFAAVMGRIREIDSEHETVLMMQVENEAGILRASRDFSPQAESAFRGNVPTELTSYLEAHKDSLIPEFDEVWTRNGRKTDGTWTEIFGTDADEVFMGWHIASFIDKVAAAGRAVYDIPMFANAWLKMGPGYLPGQYPSGGPLDKLMDVWKAAAPNIDLIAPDIYAAAIREHCEAYHRGDNPLFIPEAMHSAIAAATPFYVFGAHEAICFSPFGIDDVNEEHPLAETYRLLGDMMPLLVDAYGKNHLRGFLQQSDEERFASELGHYRFIPKTNKPIAELEIPGSALLLALSDDEFICAGRNMTFTFEPLDPTKSTGEIVWLDEGDFHEGKWQPIRRLNGDETFHSTGVLLGEKLRVVRFKLHGY